MASGKARGGRPELTEVRLSFAMSYKIDLRLTGSGRIGHISRPRRAGFEGALPGRRTDPGAAWKGTEQCTLSAYNTTRCGFMIPIS